MRVISTFRALQIADNVAIDGKSYAVSLTREQHELLQKIVPMLGRIAVDKTREVDFLETVK